MSFGEETMLKIVVDAMGGDNAPSEIVKGALDALADRGDFKVIFTGDEALVKYELDKYSYDASRVEIVPCSQVITNDDVPTSAVRSKRDSSLVVGLNILKNDISAGGFVSAPASPTCAARRRFCATAAPMPNASPLILRSSA